MGLLMVTQQLQFWEKIWAQLFRKFHQSKLEILNVLSNQDYIYRRHGMKSAYLVAEMFKNVVIIYVRGGEIFQ